MGLEVAGMRKVSRGFVRSGVLVFIAIHPIVLVLGKRKEDICTTHDCLHNA